MPSVGKPKGENVSEKKKKSVPVEGQNQRTISSFFKAGTAKPATSCLFSEVGKTAVGKLTLKKATKTQYREHEHVKKDKHSNDVIVIDADIKEERTIEDKSYNNSTEKENQTVPTKTGLNQLQNNTNFTVVKESSKPVKNSSVNSHINQDVVMVESEVKVIPETQVSLETKTPNVKGKQQEEEMIPDTPQSEKKEELAKKKIFGRSFLTVGTNLVQNPYVLKKEKVDKKQMSKARKGLLSVSVKFNATENQKECKVEHQSDKCALEYEEEKFENKAVSDKVTENIEDVDIKDDDHLHISDAETPTKVYNGERTCLKRMSKCGGSPDSKRFVERLDFDSSSRHDSKLFEEIIEGHSCTENEIGTKHLSRCLNEEKSNNDTDNNNFKDKKTSLNSKSCLLPKTECSMSYQLSMSRKKKGSKSENGGLADDNCLSSILDELDTSKSRSECLEVNSFKPSLITLKKKRKSLQSKVSSSEKMHNLSNSFNESLTEDDLKLLEDLDEKVHPNISSNLVENKNSSDNSYNESTFQKPSFITKKGILAKKKMENSNSKFSDVGDRSDDLVPTQTIVEFLSQMGKENCDFSEKNDVDIAEFPTQKETPALFKDSIIASFDTKDNISDGQPACINYGRHRVNSVEHSQNGHDICLHVTDSVTDEEKICILSGFWADTHVIQNDIVHITGHFQDNTCHISDKEGLIVVNPDILLSGTTVVSSVFCMRKGVLNEKFKGCDGGNIQMLYGSIIHCVFQQVLQKGLSTQEQILKEAEDTVKQVRYLHDMYKGNTTEGEVLEEIKKYIPQIKKWLEQYTNLATRTDNSKKDDISITKITDIEENIWSPRFGVKGKIDITVEVQIKNKGRYEKSVVPLELKTGRPTFSMEHKGQVTLYSMMSSDRRPDPGQGLLLYLKEPDMKLIPANHLNIRGLIQLRNEMAYFMNRQVSKTTSEDEQVSYHLGRLPDPINNQRACVKCAQLTNCCIYQKSIEQRNLNSSMANLVPNTLGHLLQEHLDFYVHWCLLLDLETKASSDRGGVSDLWCKTGYQREQEGHCISGLALSQHHTDSEAGFCVLTFTRHKDIQKGRTTAINMIGIAVNDYMIISTEKTNHLALCNGTVIKVTEDRVEVAVESESLQRLLNLKEEIFRLDSYSSFSTANILYTNLSKLMSEEPHSAKLRRLVIDRIPPEFLIKLSKTEIEKVKEIFKPLNKPQKTAILKVLMSKDYVLIKGYPGTGKTATIVAIVRVLNLLGLSVLLTSYTHSAVDNILLKLIKHDVSFVRLGKTSKIHPQIQRFSADVLTQKLQSVGDLREFYSQKKVVATSCLGINHPVFTQKRFDVVIVDEASQVLLPACLGPLFCAERFVLVGDPKQLPPVVQSREARGLGMDQSLFAMLDEIGGTYELNLQYRMNRQIMALSNLLVYDGALQCGSEIVANSQLKVEISPNAEQWILQVFNLEPYKAALFVDTSKVPATESKNNSGMVVNIGESQIVRELVLTCIKGGLSQDSIGVIAPYRHQVRLIHDSLMDHCVEVNTVDQYQGRDKDVIIISFTRSFKDQSSDENKSGELLKDIRRLNVAVSRAKKKLIMVGDMQTLTMYQPLSVILEMMAKDDLIVSLPNGALNKR